MDEENELIDRWHRKMFVAGSDGDGLYDYGVDPGDNITNITGAGAHFCVGLVVNVIEHT